MGIDWQNIPEEYKCEVCQPRAVDHNRARTIQLMKRKEQQNPVFINTQQQPLATDPNDAENSSSSDRIQLNPFSTINANKKKGLLTAKGRKSLFGGKSPAGSKYKRSDSSGKSSSGKKRESKKNSKRKLLQSANNSPTANQQSDSDDEKQSAPRALSESYESAVTNHYSPELRARLHSIAKQVPGQSNTAMLKNIGAIEGRCTIVPHAGGKILISTMDILPNNPIIEIRGKYMLTNQYKPSQMSQSAGYGKSLSKTNPGPFLFFYRLPNDEICVDARTYGNEARFVRRSCRPNAEIIHSIDKGTLHLYIVSLNNIKSSTEITIRHEPHDLEAFVNDEIFAPTSTVCGCGLIKDCLFGAAPSSPSTPSPTHKKVSKRYNEQKLKNFSSYKRKKFSNAKLSQSSSESGSKDAVSNTKDIAVSEPTNVSITDESNGINVKLTEPVLPIQQANVIIQQQTDAVSNNPSKGQQTPSPVTKIEPAEQAVENVVQAKVDKANGSNINSPILPLPSLPPSPTVAANPVTTVPISVDTMSPMSPDTTLKSPEPNSNPGTEEIQQTNAVHVKDEPASLKNTPSKTKNNPGDERNVTSSTQNKTSTPTKSTNVSQRKTSRKSTYSFSEDNTSGTGDDSHSKQEEKKETENRKLTREERKMEAIVRAFEKMEKSQQRKNEQKHNKTAASSSSSAKKKRSMYKNKSDSNKTPSKKAQLGKKKRKRGKAYQQTSNNKKRRSRLDSKNSDINTSEDSQLLSPKIPSAIHSDNDQLQSPKASETLQNKHDSSLTDAGSAAGMLLSLSSYCTNKSSDNSLLSSERQNVSMSESSTPNTPPFPVSSACMLIEAAVGPFDSDFKLPNKAKTKKTIMNEWLHHGDSEAYSQQSSQQQNETVDSKNPEIKHESRIKQEDGSNRDASFMFETAPGFAHSSFQEKPQNLSIAAKKIEEFIHLTSPDVTLEHQSAGHDEEDPSKWALAQNRAAEQQASSSTPPLQLGSSVKKRWLRQAISEECSDEITASASTSSPPNGFTAPLKKRRVVRQCSNLSAENVLSPTQSNSFDAYSSKELEDVQQLKYNQEGDQEMSEDDKFNYSIKAEEENVSPHKNLDDNVNVEQKEQDTENLSTYPDAEKIEIKKEVEDDYNYDDNNLPTSSRDFTPPPMPGEISPTNDWENENNERIEDVPYQPIAIPKDEIEDIQQKLRSFHNENLMILQYRNKKRMSRATTPTPAEDANPLKESPSSSSDNGRRKKNPIFIYEDELSIKREENGIQSEEIHAPAVSNTSIYNLNSLVNNATYNSYIYPNNLRDLSTHVPAQVSQQPMKPPCFTSLHPMLTNANLIPNNLIYQYLENPNRNNSYNSLNYMPPSTVMDPIHQHPLFTIHNPSLINSSNYYPKSYTTTLNEPTTTASAPSSCSNTPTVIPPKVLTRTQSADPRLNPPQTLHPSTPKRKLSINEYRKRKQLNTPSEKSKYTTAKQHDYKELYQRQQQLESPIKPSEQNDDQSNELNDSSSSSSETKETGKLSLTGITNEQTDRFFFFFKFCSIQFSTNITRITTGNFLTTAQIVQKFSGYFNDYDSGVIPSLYV